MIINNEYVDSQNFSVEQKFLRKTMTFTEYQLRINNRIVGRIRESKRCYFIHVGETRMHEISSFEDGAKIALRRYLDGITFVSIIDHVGTNMSRDRLKYTAYTHLFKAR